MQLLKDESCRIFVSVGEESGDMYAAHLVERINDEAKALGVGVTFVGIGGSNMEQVGVEVLFDTIDIATLGLIETIPYWRKWSGVWRIVKEELALRRPKLILAVSNDMFNLRLARLAQKLRIPFIYALAPEIWGWRSRIKLPSLFDRGSAAAKLSTHILSCLRIDYEAYTALGANVTYVGHPFVDIVRSTITKEKMKVILGIPRSKLLVGLLPGSRYQEVRAHLPVMLEACKVIKDKHSEEIHYVLIPTKRTRCLVERIIVHSGLRPILVNQNHRHNAIAACEFVIASSGTVVLETSCLGVPSLVVYQCSEVTWFYLKHLTVHAKWISLPNILTNRRIVPELLQSSCEPNKIASLALDWLGNRDSLEVIRRDLTNVQSSLGEPGSFQRAAKVVMRYIE